MDSKKSSLYIVIFAGVFCATIFMVYFYNFDGKPSDDQAVWGAFGDFVGGALNPILSFIALILILITIRVQSDELELTRKELQETKEIHRENLKVTEYQKKDIILARLIESLRTSFESPVYTFNSKKVSHENVSMTQLAADVLACRGLEIIENDKEVHAVYDSYLMYLSGSRVYSGLQIIKNYIEASDIPELDKNTYRILVHNTLSKEFWSICSWAVRREYFGINNTFNEPLSYFVDSYGCVPVDINPA